MLAHEQPIELTLPVRIDAEKLKNLLCCAFEGGVGYWCQIVRYEYPKGTTAADFNEGGPQQGNSYWARCQILPFCEGGAVICAATEEDDPKELRLDKEAIINGLKVLARDFPKHWADVLEEHEDADTGDCFLQCCLFGELVYG